MLKNYTKIDVPDDVRRDLLATRAKLQEHRYDCITCGVVYDWQQFRAVCRRCMESCPHDAVVPGYIIKRNGSYQVRAECFQCGAGPSTVGPVKRGGRYLDVCFYDNRDDTTCEHCGSLEGVEFHHYAPRNTFPDADTWATGYLCRSCHHLWHRTMDGYRWHRPHDQRPPTDDEVIRELIEVTGPQGALTEALRRAGVA